MKMETNSLLDVTHVEGGGEDGGTGEGRRHRDDLEGEKKEHTSVKSKTR